jgi:GlpG protein
MPLAFIAKPEHGHPLQPVLDQLDKQQIAYSVSTHGGNQLVVVEDEKLAEPVKYFYFQYLHQQDHKFSVANLKKTPLTSGILMVAFIVALMTQLGEYFVQWFFIADIQYYPRAWHFFEGWQIPWRSISPIFLHFSIEHLVFNSLMFWYLGSLLERKIGLLMYALLVIMTAVISNYAQLFDSGPLFGGLSGVAYGLVCFAFCYQRWSRHLFIPSGLFIIAVVWMILGMTQVLSLIGLGKMANVAHVSGAIAGGLMYGVYRLMPKPKDRK